MTSVTKQRSLSGLFTSAILGSALSVSIIFLGTTSRLDKPHSRFVIPKTHSAFVLQNERVVVSERVFIDHSETEHRYLFRRIGGADITDVICPHRNILAVLYSAGNQECDRWNLDRPIDRWDRQIFKSVNDYHLFLTGDNFCGRITEICGMTAKDPLTVIAKETYPRAVGGYSGLSIQEGGFGGLLSGFSRDIKDSGLFFHLNGLVVDRPSLTLHQTDLHVDGTSSFVGSFGSIGSLLSLNSNSNKGTDQGKSLCNSDTYYPSLEMVILGFDGGFLLALGGAFLFVFGYRGKYRIQCRCFGGLLFFLGILCQLSVGTANFFGDPGAWLPRVLRERYDPYAQGECRESYLFHDGEYTIALSELSFVSSSFSVKGL